MKKEVDQTIKELLKFSPDILELNASIETEEIARF